MAALARPMTRGEIDMARSIFGDAVDYARVTIHGSGFLWFGLQHRDMALSPDGNIYFTAHRYLDDFAASTDRDRHWFMHEMTHVWQHQLGYPVMLRGALRLFLDYHYELESGRRLSQYNMEAQGDLLADYFALRELRNDRVMREPRYAGDRWLYEAVLEGFLRDPAQRSHLPRWR